MNQLILKLCAAGMVTCAAAQAQVQAPASPRSAVTVVAAQAPMVPKPGNSVNMPAPPAHAERSQRAVNAISPAPSVNDTTNESPSGLSQVWDGPERSKTYSKTFPLDNSDKVSLSNIYGSIVIKTWDRKEIKIDADIKAYSNDENEVQKLIDGVSVEGNKSGDLVTFKTVMANKNGNWGTNTRNGKIISRREVKIHYVVYMPATNALTSVMQYGNFTMDDFSAPTSIKIQYGNLVAGKLSNTNNYLSVQYGKANVQAVNKATIRHQYGGGLNLGTAEELDLDIQYAGANVNTIRGNAIINMQYGSGLVIGSVENLDLNAQYVNVNVNTVKGSANIRQQYNNLNLGTVGKLKLKSEYTNATVSSLQGDGTINMSYNKLILNNIGNGTKNLSIETDYTAVSVGFQDNFNAAFTVDVEYANFNHGTGITARTLNNDDKGDTSKKSYIGKIGSGGSSNVKVKAEYGSVVFK